VLLVVEGKPVSIPHAAVAKANLVPDLPAEKS
jgi:ribosome maturation factor RimP